jgi:hypothetical protein
MTEVANPGPHEYVRLVEEQAAANRLAHRARFGQATHFTPCGNADLTGGAKVLADAELAANGLHARCDFLTKVIESSRLGRFSYEPVKVIGTYGASRPDTFGLAFQGLVLGEVQGRQPSAGTLALLGDRPSKVKLTAMYKEVRRIVDVLRAWGGQSDWRCTADRAEQALPELPVPRRMPPAGGEGGQPQPARPDDAQADAEVP